MEPPQRERSVFTKPVHAKEGRNGSLSATQSVIPILRRNWGEPKRVPHQRDCIAHVCVWLLVCLDNYPEKYLSHYSYTGSTSTVLQLTYRAYVGRIEGIFYISGYYARLAYTPVSDQNKLKEDIVRLGHVSVSSLVPRP